jgi:hypothetical protein
MLLLCAVMAGTVVPALADDPEARKLVTQVRDSVPTEPMVAKATLKGSGGWVRELTMSHKQIGDDRATLLEVTAPGDVAGSRYLFLERTEGSDRQFMYLPKLTARVIEVMDAARHEPFLGSDFYVSDLMAPDVAAFTYALSVSLRRTVSSSESCRSRKRWPRPKARVWISWRWRPMPDRRSSGSWTTASTSTKKRARRGRRGRTSIT